MSWFRRAGAEIARILERTANPGAVANELQLYAKDAAGVTQLFAQTSDGSIYQLTPPPGGGTGGIVEVVASSQVTSIYANGVSFTPLVKALDDTIEFQFRAAATGTFGVNILYAMSAANGGDVQLRADVGVIALGVAPSTALTAGTPFVFTPGNDVLMHLISDALSTDLSIAASSGDLIRVAITRVDGAPDTHTGDLRAVQVAVVTL
jgi:hypothetical protein